MLRINLPSIVVICALSLAASSVEILTAFAHSKPGSQPAAVPDPKLPTNAKIDYINPDPPAFHVPKYEGQSYEALVPDTLDLAERARLAINGLTRMLNPNIDYQMYFTVCAMAEPPTMIHTGASDLNTVGKFLEVLPLMRTMCGSKDNMEAERVLLLNTLRDQGRDGMIYLPVGGRSYILPPTFDSNSGWPGQDSGITQVGHLGYGASRSVGALLIYSQLDPEGPWKEAARRLNKAFENTVVLDDDYAYNFKPFMAPNERVIKPDNPPKKILGGQSAWVIRYLMMFDRAYGDPTAVELAHKMANYNMGPLGYFASDGRFLDDCTTDMSHGGPGAHFHTHVTNILAALDVVQKTHDKKLLDRALSAYEWGKSSAAQGSNLIGFFPEVVFAVPGYINSEICEVSDMICAAVELSRLDADRWDDADRWTRNMLAEAQMTNVNWRLDGHIPQSEYVVLKNLPANRFTTDRVMERYVGAFSGWPAVNDFVGRAHNDKSVTSQNCCTASGCRALFYVWRNMLDFDQGVLKVNLLFNRASTWADIDSYIPYQGRLDVKVKQDLKDLEVRLPQWVEPHDVVATVDGANRSLSFTGRYAKVGPMKSGETCVFRFPISERTVREKIQGTEYAFVVRGNDVVDVEPHGHYCPFYQRSRYRSEQPLYRKVSRFVSNPNLDWW